MLGITLVINLVQMVAFHVGFAFGMVVDSLFDELFVVAISIFRIREVYRHLVITFFTSSKDRSHTN